MHDGPTASSPQLWRGSGSILPAVMISSGSVVLVTWTSDESETRSGWSLVYVASGVASLMLTTDAMIVDAPKDKKGGAPGGDMDY